MIKFNWGMRACGIFLLWATTAVALPAQTVKTLHSFDGTDGSSPEAALVQATNGNLYGIATDSGANGDGTIFAITPGGTLTTLHAFNGADGTNPNAPLIQAKNGNFYGTTPYGGVGTACSQGSGCGTIFTITPSGALTTLYNFCSQSNCVDGEMPYGGLIQATDGNFYGTTEIGGANGQGTVFKITASGSLTTLHNFCSKKSGCRDGSNPVAALVQSADGNYFYGTTQFGGIYNSGTLFRITPSGTLTKLHTFSGGDGSNPVAALIQSTDGNFYGTTLEGGFFNNNAGTAFKITPSGELFILYNFCSESNCADGAAPYAGVIEGTDGNLYGTTEGGGANGHGTAFTITPGGTLTTLHSFCSQANCADGSGPQGGLAQDTDGTFYGATVNGGADSYGTIYGLSAGSGPFVKIQPASGKMGAGVKILGTNLTGATSVTFNGTAATFTVKSKFEITTTVPTGATTGTVQVVTPSGGLSSNVPFEVRP